MFSLGDATDPAQRRVSFVLEQSACGQMWVQDVRCAIVKEVEERMELGEKKKREKKKKDGRVRKTKGVCVVHGVIWNEG